MMLGQLPPTSTGNSATILAQGQVEPAISTGWASARLLAGVQLRYFR